MGKEYSIMKLISKEYNFRKDSESITIKVNEEVSEKPIWIEQQNHWMSPEEAIEYYKWVGECIKNLTNLTNNIN